MMFLPLIALLGSVAATPPALGQPAPAAPLESVYAVSQDAGGVVVQVRSNGCTSAASFTVTLTPGAGGTAMALERKKPDYCRALLRDGVAVKWTWADLGIAAPEQLVLLNPVSVH